ncbi:MAG: Unknown protein [uncultured Sulfurovum sp.]|uniref:Uncharacterized protein n=1 Tax=uncultured Sulfurovum sp. TaxID=269237 RepID=A0A6S6TTP9_9BACT|nr:MAG: Unknown protein [uncultured Sulfurovum sp.]
MKNHNPIKPILIIILLCFQPLIAKTIQVNNSLYTEAVQISKTDMLIDIFVAIVQTVRAFTTTSREVNKPEEKERNWLLVGAVTILALGAILAVFQSDEE